jgi:hypothetical protein
VNWILVVAAVILIGAAAFGVFLAVRSPGFWFGLIIEVVKAAIPIVGKRNTPEIESEMQKCYRRGGEWDNFKKKCRYK